jgi:hypothetical protein
MYKSLPKILGPVAIIALGFAIAWFLVAPKDQNTVPTESAPSAAGGPGSEPAPPPLPITPLANSARPVATGPDQITVRGADALDHFGSLDYQPVRDGPVFRGMRVEAADAGVTGLAMTGLQAGDLITSVNGVPLKDEVQFMAAIRDMAASGRVTFGALRAGKPLSVTIEVTE